MDGWSLPGKRPSGSPCERMAEAEVSRKARRMCRGIWLDKHNRLQVSSLRSGVVDCGGKSEMEGLMECKAPNNLQIAS